MKFTSAIAASILAFCASASAWTEDEYSLYAREAELLAQEQDLYAREADFDYDYGVDHLHPRDAYEYGLYMGELQARAAPTKKDDLKNYAAKSNKADQLAKTEKQQQDQLKKDQAALKKTQTAEKINNKGMDRLQKKLGARSYDDFEWEW